MFSAAYLGRILPHLQLLNAAIFGQLESHRGGHEMSAWRRLKSFEVQLPESFSACIKNSIALFRLHLLVVILRAYTLHQNLSACCFPGCWAWPSPCPACCRVTAPSPSLLLSLAPSAAAPPDGQPGCLTHHKPCLAEIALDCVVSFAAQLLIRKRLIPHRGLLSNIIRALVTVPCHPPSSVSHVKIAFKDKSDSDFCIFACCLVCLYLNAYYLRHFV